MYAVIATGGKQYRVSVGDTLQVEKLAGTEVDGSVRLRPVLLVADDGTVTGGRDALGSASVSATVVEQVKGPKLTVLMYRNKTGYRRKNGHRQPLTRIRVDAISAGGDAQASAAAGTSPSSRSATDGA
jgi:large subunit ribosomal protein L21